MRAAADLEEPTLELAKLAVDWCVEGSTGDRPHAAESRDEFPFCLRLLCWPWGRRRPAGRLRRIRLNARTGRRRRRLARLRRESADRPAESPVAELPRHRARGPRAVRPQPVGERRAELDPTRGVEAAVVRRRLGALDVVLGEPVAR